MVNKIRESAIKTLEFNPHDLACEELRHVYRGKSSGKLIVLFSGFVAAAMLAWDMGELYAGAWYIWLLLAHGWHWRLGRPDFLSANASIELVRINRHVMAAAIAGLGWGALSIALPLLSRPGKAAILIIMLIAVIMAMPRLVVFLPVFFAFATGVFAPLLLMTPFLDFETQHMVLVMLLVVGATLWASAREVRKILIDVLLKQVSSEQASWEDKLTGIGNRRSFDVSLATTWAQASRAKVPLSLIMVDVDFFKKFNDAYGHQAGDDCLRQVAAALDGCARRAGDVVTRYGGEEFAVVLFHTSLNEAQNIGENMLAAVRKLGIRHEQSSHEIVTISIGIATVVPTVERDMHQLIEAADKSLYCAKERGRNRAEWQMLSHASAVG
ncbi:diguanylate cyclase (GGDEF) domain-containing protein [Methylophilus rhizosphaerae]|uniref:diguanylate cyclase n=1 Tax=Methylophilus rhizosphaerae TaxID=492660 RepID=A0A1G9A3X2_9PROT|nr:diguanylate cyclase [Methylophilus rhizosphaerae]SDK21941.1 diguanylate cyclase (GGDEF) domain-containing protein [Methylophilus rhizosphaerae]